MHYVYIIQSNSNSREINKGLTSDLRDRLARHNRGEIKHTSKYRPWKIMFYLAFEDRDTAASFEKYLKSGSGIAFMHKRLLKRK
ncbi:GIY-YIG nuclease family protein [Patescibacteria group bacterium]|nr:GIY-YIG nuclease family protein [Patescibacteria group bacterium]MBU1906994.1 GIY-YIG nuclease family protein [Patescibacteria group bacterium]